MFKLFKQAKRERERERERETLNESKSFLISVISFLIIWIAELVTGGDTTGWLIDVLIDNDDDDEDLCCCVNINVDDLSL